MLLVDLQRDFCADGALPVPGTERVVRAANRYIDEAIRLGVRVFASRDWHPPTSRHFADYGGRWPVHAVQGTPGAAFHPSLQLPSDHVTVVSKGLRPDALRHAQRSSTASA